MRRHAFTWTTTAWLALHASSAPAAGHQPAAAVLERYCAACHSGDDAEADVRLDALAQLPVAERTDLIARMREVLHFDEMPPEDEAQPTDAERSALLTWLSSLEDDAAVREKLRHPHYGNVVDHDQLFSGEARGAASTPARRWLVNPQIFHERVMDVFWLTGRDRDGKQHRGFFGVTNPFVLPDRSGVRDYDLDALDGGDLLVMLGNARWIADRQLMMARRLGGERDLVFSDKRDRWMPRQIHASYRAFTDVVQRDGAPDAAQTDAAIRAQFACVLRREPDERELRRYRALFTEAVALGDNVQGLRQLLVAVLLESEFVYRMEFGDGDLDEHGRALLDGREAAYAISYALGDRRPDQALLDAAAEGRLRTRDDYAQQVRRLLADERYYRGQIDPSLNGKHYKSNVTSHPKLVRFFREFFGYPGATKVFKDPPRSGGVYQNPGRGTVGTPGRLILETDRIVTRFVEADRDVFGELLTSDQFFVYHDKDNAAGEKVLEEWRSVYERLKDTDWIHQPQQVLTEHVEFLKTIPSMRVRDDSRPGELVNYMHFFTEHFGRGIRPFTTIPWAHGYTFHHAPLYNLPPTPSIGRYGSWKNTKYTGDKVKPREFWDYPPTQPFAIEHRKGVLTHPSWLIAHSTNFHPDAIRRGRWIREKLLAGRVPDVPITVDAQVPDDPHRTFRQRVEDVTAPRECARCHRHMNPLGLPFEAFDDFGRFRVVEQMEHPDNLLKKGNGKTTFDVYPTEPVVTTGALAGTGDPELDGPVKDPFELIDRLARADRVRQSIIRHAFRYFLGRNELLSDADTLLAADRAYVESGGSFRAVVVALLSSDSFRYRKALAQ